jgi:HEAT repeat protein
MGRADHGCEACGEQVPLSGAWRRSAMKRFLLLLLVVVGTPTPSRAYLEVSPTVPTLGRVVNQSTRIVVLQVDKVSREKQIVIYKKVADLKGKDSDDVVKHKLTDGYHPRESRTVLDWAEPGELAVCFYTGGGAVTCLGRYWYLCSADESGWGTMIAGRPEMAYCYSGSVARLRDHVTAILAGREVVVTALKYEVLGLAPAQGKWIERKLEHWATYEAICCGRLMRGKEWPVWRIKASFRTQTNTIELVQESLIGKTNHLVGDGAAAVEEVPELIKALNDENARVRLEAAEDLGLVGPPAAAAVPALLKLMEPEADPLVRVAAAKAVARIDPKNKTAVPLLIEALKDKAGKVQKMAAESLGDLGPESQAAVAALVKAAKDSDPTVSWAAIDALGQIGPGAEAAVPTLIETLKDAGTRGAVVDALGQMGRKAQTAIPALEGLLKGDHVNIRWPAAASLVRIGGPGAKAGVQFLLRPDSVPGRSRYDATHILTAPSAREALPELISAVRDPALRDAATDVAGNVSMYWKKELIPDGVRTLLHDEDPAVRCVAAWFLHRGGQALAIKDALAVLQETLKSPDPWVRRQAARCLGSLGPNAKDAAPALSALVDDKDEGVRDAVAKALKSIQQR